MFLLAGLISLFLVQCKSKDNSPTPVTVKYTQKDHMGRPAIATVFLYKNDAQKDAFNSTIPSEMKTKFTAGFQATLGVLNGGYKTNLLGWDAATLSGALAADVLTIDTSKPSAFLSLNGRKLDDDVVDIALTLIYGGANGTELPIFTKDNVNANDKAFSNTFPYLATPH